VDGCGRPGYELAMFGFEDLGIPTGTKKRCPDKLKAFPD